MSIFIVKRPPVFGVNDPNFTISKEAWDAPLDVSGQLAIENGGTGGFDQESALAGLGASPVTRIRNARGGTSYTLALADAGNVVSMNNPATNTIIVPANSVVPFPRETQIDLFQLGAGQTSIVAASGVVIRPNSGLKIAGQFLAASLYQLSIDEWLLFGAITE